MCIFAQTLGMASPFSFHHSANMLTSTFSQANLGKMEKSIFVSMHKNLAWTQQQVDSM
jgi:hypothetical protein